MSESEADGASHATAPGRRGRTGGAGREPASGPRRARVGGGRLVAVAAVLVAMASAGQCQLPEPKFPKLGGAPSGPVAGPSRALRS